MLCGEEREFFALVACPAASCRAASCRAASCQSASAVARWAETLALRAVGGGGEQIGLRVQAATPIEPSAAAPYVGDLLRLDKCTKPHLFRIALQLGRPPVGNDGRTVQLFDLIDGDGQRRTRSVAVFACRKMCLNLAFASDLHVAEVWETIGQAVDRHLPEYAGQLVRPHRLLKRFVAEANALVARGELDLVVLGGDLVDHVYPGRRQAGHANGPSNVDRLLVMLAGLQAPSLAIAGNHDFRGYPWRAQVYGLRSVGFSPQQTRTLLRKAGLRERWPLGPADLDALRTTDCEGRPVIREHLTHLNPTLDFCCTLHGLRMVFLSSGRDALPQARHIEPARWLMLARGLRWIWRDPDSEGFSQQQVERLGRWLDGIGGIGGTAVFFHSPLLASGDAPLLAGGAAPLAEGRLGVDSQHTHQERVALERRLQVAGIRQGVSLQNAGAVLAKLRDAQTAVAAFSGHHHATTALAWHPASQSFQSLDPAQARGGDDTILLLSAPAVGQVRMAANQPPGYLLARFEDGKLTKLERRALPTREEDSSLV